jgi:hypothetical protein
MKHFAESLFGLIKAHPWMFLLFILVVVLVLGGLTWKVLGFLFGLIRKVPGGAAVANAAEGAVNRVASATGSA